jgi:hypothetical protein
MMPHPDWDAILRWARMATRSGEDFFFLFYGTSMPESIASPGFDVR